MRKSHEFAINLIRQYRWNSILLKYWKKLILVFLVPFIFINSAVYLLYRNVLEDEFNASFQHSCSKTVYLLDTVFSDFDTLFSQLGYNPKVLYYILATPEDRQKSYAISNNSKLSELLHFFQLSKDYLNSIVIYSDVNGFIITSTQNSHIDALTDCQWYEHYEATGEEDFAISVRKEGTGEFQNIFVCYGLKSGKETKGLLVYDLSTDYISEIIHADLSHSLTAFYIVDQQQNILYSSNNDPAERVDAAHPVWPAYQAGAHRDLQLTATGSDSFVSTRIFNDRLTLIFQAEPDYLKERTSPVNTVFMLCLLAAILIPILMTLYISLMFYRSLHHIIVSLSANDADDNMNEIDFIIHQIGDMIKANKSSEHELIQKIQQLKRTQSMALQTQFNPHFLFNTLNIVNLMVAKYAKGSNDASRTIVLLSDLLAASMDTNEYVLTLKEELDYARKYTEIRRIQYDNSFQTLWDVHPDTLDCMVLKLMLQPIIENAFQHGMKLMPSGRTFMIQISSHIVKGRLEISIHNNGQALSLEKLRELQDMLENDDILQSNHIGLNNINQRVKLLFGEEYGCVIDSDGDGFSVTIALPVRRSPEAA